LRARRIARPDRMGIESGTTVCSHARGWPAAVERRTMSTDSEVSPQAIRHILIVSHTHRDEAVAATVRAISVLHEAGVQPVLDSQDREEFAPHLDVEQISLLGRDIDVSEVEVAIVLGGDGTILRAAELL